MTLPLLGAGRGVPVPAAASGFAQDSFTDVAGTLLADHTPEIGGPWVEHPLITPNLQITDAGRMRPSSGGAVTAVYYATAAPATAEYDVEADSVRLGATSPFSGIAGRISNAAHTLYSARYNSSTASWQLVKLVDGALTDLGSFAQALTLGQSYRVKLEIRDAAKKVYIDGVERISSADNAITSAGQAGFRVNDTSPSDTAGMHFDNFEALDV